jgi:hypothetical protein
MRIKGKLASNGVTDSYGSEPAQLKTIWFFVFLFASNSGGSTQILNAHKSLLLPFSAFKAPNTKNNNPV